MIRIQVITYNEAAPTQPLIAEFDELGGNIGRAEGSALVLHDPSRTISRTHASVVFRDGDYHIRNLGTAMPVYVNGQPLGKGCETVISAGDEIRINGYTMEVAAGATSEPASGGYRGVSATSKDDPLKLFEARPGHDPFDDLLTPSLKQNPPLTEGDGDTSAGPGSIPSDFDPFAETPEPAPERRPDDSPSRPSPESHNDVLDLGFGPSAPNQSIGELFDLAPEKNSEPFAPDSPLASPLERSDKANVDPFVAVGVALKKKHFGEKEKAQRDDVPELHGSFYPPEAKPDAAMRVPPGVPQTPEAPSPEPHGMVLSWENKESEQDGGDIRSVIIPSPGHDRRKAERRRRDLQLEGSAEAMAPKIGHSASAGASDGAISGTQFAPTVMPDSRSTGEREELLRAFLDGAGISDVVLPAGITPQFMNMLGCLLRESTQGTLDLLLARTLTKREMRAELTMIAPKENNPLKFSPTVEVALAHLLAPQGRGFMTPLQAMRDAHNDLRSHQFGFMAGLQAALAGVLERFDPKELERRLAQKTVMDSFLPINRKAKLWDLFAERHKDISQEAEEDFHVLFGREFLRAYEAQIVKLEEDDKP